MTLNKSEQISEQCEVLSENSNVAPKEFATLQVRGQDYCIPIQEIRETRRWSPVTSLPRCQPFILGVMNLRGVVIPVVDLGRKLGYDSEELTDRHVIIILEHDNMTFGMVADSIQEILSVTPDQIKSNGGVEVSGFDDVSIDGLIAKNDGMIRVISVENLASSIRNSDE